MEKHEHTTHIKNLPYIGVIIPSVIIGIFILAGAFVLRGGNDNTEFVDPDKIFMGRDFKPEEFLKGSVKNKVIFLEYSDTECPFCKKFHEESTSKIESDAKYNDVAMVYRHYPLPFHTKAPKEAEATLCARELGGQEAYKKYINTIFSVTPANNGLDEKELPNIASTVGLDVAKFNTCLSSGKYAQQVQDDLSDGNAVGVSGTPHSLVMVKNGDQYRIIARIEGARDYKYVSAVLDQVLKMVK